MVSRGRRKLDGEAQKGDGRPKAEWHEWTGGDGWAGGHEKRYLRICLDVGGVVVDFFLVPDLFLYPSRARRRMLGWFFVIRPGQVYVRL